MTDETMVGPTDAWSVAQSAAGLAVCWAALTAVTLVGVKDAPLVVTRVDQMDASTAVLSAACWVVC